MEENESKNLTLLSTLADLLKWGGSRLSDFLTPELLEWLKYNLENNMSVNLFAAYRSIVTTVSPKPEGDGINAFELVAFLSNIANERMAKIKKLEALIEQQLNSSTSREQWVKIANDRFNTINALEKEIDKLIKEKKEKDKEISEKSSAIESLQDSVGNWSARERTAKIQVSDLNAKIGALEEKIVYLKSQLYDQDHQETSPVVENVDGQDG